MNTQNRIFHKIFRKIQLTHKLSVLLKVIAKFSTLDVEWLHRFNEIQTARFNFPQRFFFIRHTIGHTNTYMVHEHVLNILSHKTQK